MKVSVLTIGEEIITGDIVDSNSAFLCKELTALGHNVNTAISVGDSKSVISETVLMLLKNCDILFVTGGLGPTIDDITAESVAKALGRNLVYEESIFKMIEARFLSRNLVMSENNKKQAYKIENSFVIENEYGTACGSKVIDKDKIIYILPGPPFELKKMFEKLRVELQSEMIIKRNLYRCLGIGESALETKVKDIITSEEIEYGIYASKQYVDIKITVRNNNECYVDEILNKYDKMILEKIGKYIYSKNDDIVTTVVKSLIDDGLKLSVAESCTGGMLTSMIVDVAGASKVLKESVVSYSNESKVSRLGVDENTLNEYGAVSKEVAMQMAKGVSVNLASDIGIATTGIASPTSSHKRCGLVYVCIYYKEEYFVKEFNIEGDRQTVRRQACLNAFEMLYKLIYRR